MCNGQTLPSEEARRLVESKYMRVHHLTAELRGRDLEIARLLEDKMRLMCDLLVVTGARDPMRDDPPDYLSLVRPDRSAAAAAAAAAATGAGDAAVAGGVAAGGFSKEELLNLVQVRKEVVRCCQIC